jgi:hypothetical protein
MFFRIVSNHLRCYTVSLPRRIQSERINLISLFWVKAYIEQLYIYIKFLIYMLSIYFNYDSKFALKCAVHPQGSLLSSHTISLSLRIGRSITSKTFAKYYPGK